MSNYPPGVDANTTDAPWNQPDPKRQTKTITGYVRFAGVYKRKIEVPVDFDTSDSEAVSDALHDDCQVNRPAFAQDRSRQEGRDPNDPQGLVNTKRRLRRDRPAQGQN